MLKKVFAGGLVGIGVNQKEDVLLAADVVVDVAVADAGFPGQVLEGGLVVPLLGKEADGREHELLAAFLDQLLVLDVGRYRIHGSSYRSGQTMRMAHESPGSEVDTVQPLEAQDFPGLGRAGRLEAQLPGDADQLGHLLAAVFGQHPLVQIQVVLEAHPGVAAHDQGLGGHGELVPAGRADRPGEVPDQTTGLGDQIDQVFDRGRNAAQDAQDELEIDRRLDMPGVDQIGQVVDHAHVVDFELGLGALGLEGFEELAHGVEGVGKDEVLGPGQVVPLPVVLPVRITAGHVKQAEVERAGIERGQFRAQGVHDPDPVFHRFADPAARGGAQDDVAPLLHFRGDAAEGLLIRVGRAGRFVTDVDVGHRAAGLVHGHDVGDDLGGGQRQVRGHGRGVDGAGDGGGEYALVSGYGAQGVLQVMEWVRRPGPVLSGAVGAPVIFEAMACSRFIAGGDQAVRQNRLFDLIPISRYSRRTNPALSREKSRKGGRSGGSGQRFSYYRHP